VGEVVAIVDEEQAEVILADIAEAPLIAATVPRAGAFLGARLLEGVAATEGVVAEAGVQEEELVGVIVEEEKEVDGVEERNAKMEREREEDESWKGGALLPMHVKS
jgi:hypothetical protein